MANLDRIVNSQITLETAALDQLNFDKLLIVGPVTMTPAIAWITSPNDLINDAMFGPLTSSSVIYKAAVVAFSQIPSPTSVAIGKRAASGDVAAAMAAIKQTDNNWYVLMDASRDATAIEDFADWAEANEKLHVTSLELAQTTGDGNVATSLQTGNYFRTAWWLATDTATDFPDVAAAVKAMVKQPGGETWANMRLANTPATNINETTFLAVKALGGNTFEPFRNQSITQIGQVVGGEWLDIIRFRDWLNEQIRIDQVSNMIDRRIPFTDPGIQSIGSILRMSLDLGVRRFGIAPPELSYDGTFMMPSYTLYLPRSSQISVNDKANRILRDVRWTARLAGAIHAMELRGTLTYANF